MCSFSFQCPFTMTDYKRPPLEGLFGSKSDDSDSLLPVRQQIEKFESKSRFNKSRPAPQPPGGQIQLPKIGNYQPKILLRHQSDKRKEAPKPPTDYSSNVGNSVYSRHLNRSESMDTGSGAVTYQRLDSEPTESAKNVMIIGDKDTPITVHQTSEDDGGAIDRDSYYSPYGTQNPTFESDSEVKRDDIQTENDALLDFDDISKISNFDEDDKVSFDSGKVKSNPLFGHDVPLDMEEPGDENVESPRRSTKSIPAPLPPPSEFSSAPSVDYTATTKPNLDTVNESEEPYIPEPDYDEDEVTMSFDEYAEIPSRRPTGNDRPEMRPKFPGEDYSQYLSEDEDYFSDNTFTWRKDIHYRRKGSSQQGKQRPMSHPQKPAHRDRPRKSHGNLKPVGKPKRDSKVEHIKRNTIRDFSFSDSKIGFGDRTVNSTSAKGRYEKRNKGRPRIEGSEGSYEEFLRMRQNENGSSSSADSGHDAGDDLYMQNSVFANSQPKQVREKKGSMWQRLTWRFKRHSAYNLS